MSDNVPYSFYLVTGKLAEQRVVAKLMSQAIHKTVLQELKEILGDTKERAVGFSNGRYIGFALLDGETMPKGMKKSKLTVNRKSDPIIVPSDANTADAKLWRKRFETWDELYQAGVGKAIQGFWDTLGVETTMFVGRWMIHPVDVVFDDSVIIKVPTEANVKPHPDLKEIKEWEALKMVDDENQKNKDRANAAK
jgi:hypothetical protein